LKIKDLTDSFDVAYDILTIVDTETITPGETEMGDVPDPLKRNLDWYIEHQNELAAKYNGKVLLIVDQLLVGAFNSMQDAYTAALKKYVPGSFTLQPCSPDPDSYTLMLFSPFYSAHA
jgi:hypothetical protein